MRIQPAFGRRDAPRQAPRGCRNLRSVMSDFPPPLPHGPIRELFPDVYVVRSCFRLAPMVSIARNMIILRQGGSSPSSTR